MSIKSLTKSLINAKQVELEAECFFIDPAYKEFMIARLTDMSAASETVTEEELKAYSDGYGKAKNEDGTDKKPYAISNGVAIIPVKGVLSKEPDFWSYIFGGTSLQHMEQWVTQALSDSEAPNGVTLQFDTPGGSTSGMQNAANFLKSVSKFPKPGTSQVGSSPGTSVNPQGRAVKGFVSGQCCSAGYWLGSQLSSLDAEVDAEVGSLGTYAVLRDTSKMYADMGIKTTVVRRGAMKGMGTPGTPITKEYQDYVQRKVDAINAIFMTGIQARKGMTAAKVAGLNTGESWMASEAKDLGLIDNICTLADHLVGFKANTVAFNNMSAKEKNTFPLSASLSYNKVDDNKTVERSRSKSSMIKNPFTTLSRAHEALASAGVLDDSEDDTEDDVSATSTAVVIPARPARVPLLQRFALNSGVGSSPGTSFASDTVVATLTEAGVINAQSGCIDADKLQALVKAAAVGTEHHKTLVAEAQAEAVRLYGADNGPKVAARLTEASFHADVVAAHDSWRAEADAKWGTGKGVTPNRVSAAAKLPSLGESINAENSVDDAAVVKGLMNKTRLGAAAIKLAARQDRGE